MGAVDLKVFKVVRLPKDPQDRPKTIAFTSEASAQRIIASMAEQSSDDFQLSYFEDPTLLGVAT